MQTRCNSQTKANSPSAGKSCTKTKGSSSKETGPRMYVRSGTHAEETSSEVPDVWVAASDEALAIRAGMGQEGREFFASQPASKELACELPGSLGLGQSYVRPPKTLEGQENRTCSDCCTKRPPYVFFLTSRLPAKPGKPRRPFQGFLAEKGQKTPKRTVITSLGSPGLSSQSVSGLSGRKWQTKTRNGQG